MYNKLKAVYQFSQPPEWYDTLAAQGFGEIINDEFIFDESIGKGKLNYVQLLDGLWAQNMNFILNKPISVSKTGGNSNKLFIINFFITNAELTQSIDGKVFNFKYDQVSVMLNSLMSESTYELPSEEPIRIFQIGLTREWLLENVIDKHNEDMQIMFNKERPIYLVENLDFKQKSLLNSIDLDNSSQLQIISAVVQLLQSFFGKLESRNFEPNNSNQIHRNDMEAMLDVKAQIDNNPLEPLNMDALVDQSGMSLSKFKRLFKQMFGDTPYNYYLRNKLHLAMDMLLEKNYSVSETGYVIGYNNLSHFSKAFKKQFNILPSEVKK